MKANDIRANLMMNCKTELHSSLRELFNLRMQSELSEGLKPIYLSKFGALLPD